MNGKHRVDRPNIVVLLADDMGFGDVGAFNQDSLIPTPNMDRLAAESLSFGDAHSSSAVCSPSRYSLLTGRYCWRSPLKSGVFYGYEPPIIEPDRITLPRFLQGLGYRTACVGKWHLGLQYQPLLGSDIDLTGPLPWPEATRELELQIDFDRPVIGGPLELGFDEFFGTSGCPTCQPPYGFLEGDRFIDPPRIYDGLPPYTGRPGMASPEWRHAEADPQILDRACQFIASAAKRDEPFFAYVALDSPHEPCTPGVVPFVARNRSRAGPRGDLVWFVDYAAGRLRRELEDAGVWNETIFVVTSDNGALPGDRVIDEAGNEIYRTYGHRSSGPWRGYKAHIWEGGHREPLIISWPGRVDAGRRAHEMVCLMDLFATFAEILEAPIPTDAEDSISFAWTLTRDGDANSRRSLVNHSQRGVFAFRLESIKLVVGTQGSGGWPPPSGAGPDPQAPGQLYDLSEDPGETANLWFARPQLVKELSASLAEVTRAGRVDL